MITSFYTASVGASQVQKGMDVVANNIANVSTTGYKPTSAVFSDLLYTNMQANDPSLKAGHGTKVQSTDCAYEMGAPQPTGRSLDYFLEDRNAFFAVQTPEGIQYTRAGNFYLSEINGQFFLASPLGGLVLDQNYQAISVDPNTVGEQSTELPIAAFSFPNMDGIIKEGNNAFSPTQNSGQPQVVQNPTLRNGVLESSAVNMAQEMSTVIQLQRAFQFNCRMVQIADEIMQGVNNMR